MRFQIVDANTNEVLADIEAPDGLAALRAWTASVDGSVASQHTLVAAFLAED